MNKLNKIRVVVLISGNGSNLQNLIEQSQDGSLPIEIVAVISNNPDAFGLVRAKEAKLPSIIVNNKNFITREEFDHNLQQNIDDYQPDLVVLAGFMRILSDDFVIHYLGKMLNIHPSLLPKYRGLNTHRRALENNEKFHGVSVHFVTPELDGGPVILQSRVAVDPTDDADTLAKRVQEQEHIIYPIAITWFALNRLRLENGSIIYDDQILEKPIMLESPT